MSLLLTLKNLGLKKVFHVFAIVQCAWLGQHKRRKNLSAFLRFSNRPFSHHLFRVLNLQGAKSTTLDERLQNLCRLLTTSCTPRTRTTSRTIFYASKMLAPVCKKCLTSATGVLSDDATRVGGIRRKLHNPCSSWLFFLAAKCSQGFN